MHVILHHFKEIYNGFSYLGQMGTPGRLCERYSLNFGNIEDLVREIKQFEM